MEIANKVVYPTIKKNLICLQCITECIIYSQIIIKRFQVTIVIKIWNIKQALSILDSNRKINFYMSIKFTHKLMIFKIQFPEVPYKMNKLGWQSEKQ